MPCNDITDLLKLQLDADDRLISYRLSKRTCGAEVGNYSLIDRWAEKKSTNEILATSPESFLEAHPPSDDTEEFLYLKHYFSLRGAIESLTGKTPVGPGAPCKVEKVDYGPDGLILTASIRVDLVANQVKACGNCGTGCKVKKKRSS